MRSPLTLWKLKRAEDCEIARLEGAIRTAANVTDTAQGVDLLWIRGDKDTFHHQQCIRHIRDAKLMRQAERYNVVVGKDDIVPEYRVLSEILRVDSRERLKREIRERRRGRWLSWLATMGTVLTFAGFLCGCLH